MSIEMDEKKIKRRILLQYFRDGLWDINIGITILLFGIGMIIDEVYLAGIWAAIGSTLVVQAKDHFTYPRLGFVKFKNNMKYKRIGIFAGIFLLGIVIAALFSMDQSTSIIVWLRTNFNLVLASVFGGLMLLFALLVNAPRLYIYAFGLSIVLVLSKWIGSIGINLALAGGLISIIGIYLLIRFIRLNPKQQNPAES